MPASGNPEGQEEARTDAAEALDTAEELAQLETAIDSLVQDFGSMRDRAAVAEENHRKLAEALRDTDLEDMAPTELQERLEELADENSRLRAIVTEAGKRAERIRSRLMLMEDELADD
jgi:chromosome segregation ATPase